MRQITVEIPVTAQSRTSSFIRALETIEIIEVLEFRSGGISLLCSGTADQLNVLKSAFNSSEESANLNILNVKNDGSVVALVKGVWTGRSNGISDPKHEEEMEFFRSMENSHMYTVGKLTFEHGVLKTTVLGERETIARLLEGLREHNIKFRVKRIGPPEGKERLMLSSLSQKQQRVLRLAHELGYYEIPRKIRTQELANIVGIDKGTLGDHLRRAEKHIMDEVMKDQKEIP